MAVRPILLLGNPALRTRCRRVRQGAHTAVGSVIADLRDTLAAFRNANGFGRGIAAPQIGCTERILYLEYEFSGPMINPVIERRSRKKFMLWDDCFSFPNLLVKVERAREVEVSFVDEHGRRKRLSASGGLSELLQHEIDHLDGILAIDRAIDTRHIILRSEFEKLQRETELSL